MKINLLINPNYIFSREVKKAVYLMKQVQSKIDFELSEQEWVPDQAEGAKEADDDSLRYKKEGMPEKSPGVVITSLPLKSGYTANYCPGYYIFTTQGWMEEYPSVPLGLLMVSYIAGVCCHFSCELSEADSDQMTDLHRGKPSGCISDFAPGGNKDLYLSLKKSHICTRCSDFYLQKGCDPEDLNATVEMLDYLRKEVNRYDKNFPPDVFISYSRTDLDLVSRLHEALEERRIGVWLDREQNYIGEDLAPAILKGIKKSLTFVPVISENSAKAEWVVKETAYARSIKRKKPARIFPVKVDSHERPENPEGTVWAVLGDVAWEDLSAGKFETGVVRLTAQILSAKKAKKKRAKKKR
jgi:hypothetical protein